MISASLLLVYAVAAGTLGASALRAAAWAAHAPRLGVIVWQSLAVSIMFALTGAGAALAVSLAPIGSGLAGVIHLCAANLRHGYASSGGALTALVGLVLIASLTARLLWHATRVTLAGLHERRAWRLNLQLVGRADTRRDAIVVEHRLPYAFCVAGRHPSVVLTTGLTELLTEPEIRAVLAHETGHLVQRHHLWLSISQTLFLTLARPFRPFRGALPQVRMLLELSADDYARRREGDAGLQAALTKLACAPVPRGALAASSDGAEERIRRIQEQQRPLGRFGVGVILTIATLAILAPLALAAAPAAEMARAGLCVIG